MISLSIFFGVNVGLIKSSEISIDKGEIYDKLYIEKD